MNPSGDLYRPVASPLSRRLGLAQKSLRNRYDDASSAGKKIAPVFFMSMPTEKIAPHRPHAEIEFQSLKKMFLL
ncbi:MAG: hypothetical protein HOE26_01925 [Rhodospirillaceae bacterium]|nr:hypothetical protein [Rhodospirillaceae bacterium]MBT5012932.1 hypothetical protein [Rhodospirillaceae bacterium]